MWSSNFAVFIYNAYICIYPILYTHIYKFYFILKKKDDHMTTNIYKTASIKDFLYFTVHDHMMTTRDHIFLSNRHKTASIKDLLHFRRVVTMMTTLSRLRKKRGRGKVPALLYVCGAPLGGLVEPILVRFKCLVIRIIWYIYLIGHTVGSQNFCKSAVV